MITDIFTQLRRDEGVRLKPYKDTVGKTTIGVGRNLDDVGISEAEANYLLGNDVSKATSAVRQKIPWADELDEARFGVLVNMTFNMGINGLLGFPRMLHSVQLGDYEEAALEMMDSAWYDQVGDRAKRLVTQMKEGTWQ